MAPNTRSTPQDFGEALKGTRTAAGVALETIADKTKISLRALSALEAGEFARLPNRVFARMFLRQYLELVGVAPEEWLLAFEAAWQRHDDSRQPTPFRPPVPIRRRRVGPWVVGLALVTAGVVGVVLVEERPHELRPPAVPPTPEPVAVAAAPTPESPRPVDTPVPPSPGVLVVRTGQAPCWVEVRVTGEKPSSRLLQASTTWEVAAGGKEIDLVLGDAGAASVEYMGEVRNPVGPRGAVAKIHLVGNAAPRPAR